MTCFSGYLSREGFSGHTLPHSSPALFSIQTFKDSFQSKACVLVQSGPCVLRSSDWLRQDVHSEEDELHSSDDDNSSTSSKEHLDEADRQVTSGLSASRL